MEKKCDLKALGNPCPTVPEILLAQTTTVAPTTTPSPITSNFSIMEGNETVVQENSFQGVTGILGKYLLNFLFPFKEYVHCSNEGAAT